jgi:hypothetical protein
MVSLLVGAGAVLVLYIYKKGSYSLLCIVCHRTSPGNGTNFKASVCFDGWLDKFIRRARSAWAGLWGAGLDRRSLETGCVWSPKAAPLDDSTSLSLAAPCALFFSVADCEVTVSWGDESTCGIFADQSDRWLGGALQLSNLAELAEPAVACNPLDNPNEPNAASPLPGEAYGWVAGPYSPPGSEGERVRTVNCMGVDGVVVNDTFCIDPTVPDDEQWRPADSTTSRPLTGKIALISRGVCAFATKGALS